MGFTGLRCENIVSRILIFVKTVFGEVFTFVCNTLVRYGVAGTYNERRKYLLVIGRRYMIFNEKITILLIKIEGVSTVLVVNLNRFNIRPLGTIWNRPLRIIFYYLILIKKESTLLMVPSPKNVVD